MHKLIHVLRKGTAGLLCGVLFLISACSDDDDHTGTQIVNDDLEGANSWQFVNVDPTFHSGKHDASVSASSSHSLSTESLAEAASGFSFWRLYVNPSGIPAGATLELTVKVKVTDVTGNGAFIAFRGDDDSSILFFETTQDKQTIAGTADFTTYTVKLDEFPEGVKYIYIFLIMHGSSTGSVNFDDISLVSHH